MSYYLSNLSITSVLNPINLPKCFENDLESGTGVGTCNRVPLRTGVRGSSSGTWRTRPGTLCITYRPVSTFSSQKFAPEGEIRLISKILGKRIVANKKALPLSGHDCHDRSHSRSAN